MLDHTLPLFSLQPETKEIPLTQGQIAIVDAADYEELSRHKWYAEKHGQGWYAARNGRRPNGKRCRVYMHRLILDVAPDMLVDHKNRNGLNNTRANLRPATQQQNQYNRPAPKSNTSGYKGVSWHKTTGTWVARIELNDKGVFLGLFTSIEEAARAYDAAARESHGEFARLNFPDSQS